MPSARCCAAAPCTSTGREAIPWINSGWRIKGVEVGRDYFGVCLFIPHGGLRWAPLGSRARANSARMTSDVGTLRTCNCQVRRPSLCSCGMYNCFVGAPLWQILAAGEWKSPAFLLYLDMHSLERDLVIQSHVDESEDEVSCS